MIDLTGYAVRLISLVAVLNLTGCVTSRDECQFHFNYSDEGIIHLDDQNVTELLNYKEYCK